MHHRQRVPSVNPSSTNGPTSSVIYVNLKLDRPKKINIIFCFMESCGVYLSLRVVFALHGNIPAFLYLRSGWHKAHPSGVEQWQLPFKAGDGLCRYKPPQTQFCSQRSRASPASCGDFQTRSSFSACAPTGEGAKAASEWPLPKEVA